MPTIQDSKCVLVVGATAGIGRALALAIHDLPSKPTVIVSGRRQERLGELAKKSKRIHGVKIDIDADRETLVKTVDGVLQKYPEVCYPRQLFQYVSVVLTLLLPRIDPRLTASSSPLVSRENLSSRSRRN